MNNHLSACLLMSERAEAQKLSALFRKIGVVPEYYDALEDFWYDVMTDVPTICVVDVALMSAGHMALKNHPNVLNETLPLAFFYSDETGPLVLSTFDFFHFGLLKKGGQYEGFLRSVLKRVNRFNDITFRLDQVSQQFSQLEKRNTNLVEKNNKLTSELQSHQLVQKFAGDLESLSGQLDLINNIGVLCDNWSDVLEFMIFQLAPDRHRLTTPPINTTKHKNISPIVLSENQTNGIDSISIKMADQVAIDVLGCEFVLLKVNGIFGAPDALIYIKTTNRLPHFSWSSLELVFNMIYAREVSIRSASLSNVLNPWQFLSLLDSSLVGTNGQNLVFINISFHKLIQKVQEKEYANFHWKELCEDFSGRLQNSIDHSYQLAYPNIENIAVLVDSSTSKKTFKAIEGLCESFDFCRYSESFAMNSNSDFSPEIQMIPLSSNTYLNFIKNKKIDVTRKTRTSASEIFDEQFILFPENRDSIS